jgi:hypothetical protein
MSFNKGKAKYGVHDDYYTPKSAWENLLKVILPKLRRKRDRNGNIKKPLRVWEPFMLNSNGASKKHLESLGCKVQGSTKHDFFNKKTRPAKNTYDLIISNPPFERVRSWAKREESLKYRCIQGLFEIDKPFVLIINSLNICSKWFHELVEPHKKHVRFIYPKKKINFVKYKAGGMEEIPMEKNSASFLSVYLCYKVLSDNEWI